ncbi:zinc finger MYM-type protein 1-like [Impatiens glandulifera]|uniref:zinc finger MYM-type protein 1-like n=1 Tax=Impatiens glandulifera TaxID=253017 RepID=UPI001FB0D198|nr:zinc finger MYM-type protein 1-like [Impatiens glandulifera]
MGKLNESIRNTILEKAPKNAKYTSPDIQKDVLNVIVNQVRTKIRQEIGDAKFFILVDEARDASNKEQMALVLRFVDIDGFLREWFFTIVNVHNTTAATLKKEISDTLGRYDLHIHNMRGQGYDGASNMRRSWNGLQALFLKDCSCAYYVHCFAHWLQLALIAVAEKEMEARYISSRSRSCQQKDSITVKYHYQFDVFVAAIDFKIEELNSRFKDKTVELLKLSDALEPKDNFKLFNVNHIYQLAEKFYHLNFDAQDLHHLRTQLAHYELDMPINERF